MPDFNRDLSPKIALDKSSDLFDLTARSTPSVDNIGYREPDLSAPENPLSWFEKASQESLSTRPKGILVSDATMNQNRRYSHYNPTINNQEDYLAYGQSNLDKAANGLLKGLGLAATTVAGGFATVYGAGKSIFTGRLADIWDNEGMRTLDAINEHVDNELLPNYYTDVEKNAEWYSTDNWFKTNFLFDKLIRNSGFAVGAMVSGNIFNAGLLRAGTAIGKMATAGATAAEASQAFKLFTPLLKNTARAFSQGKNIEAAAVLEKGISSIADLTAKSSELAKIATQFNKFANIGEEARRTAIAIYSSAGEAAFEALQTAKEYKNSLIEKYKEEHYGEEPDANTLQQIEAQAESVGKTAFLGNMALLSATEYVQLPYLLGSSYKASKQASNSFSRTAQDVVLEGGEYAAKKSSTIYGKLLDKASGTLRYIFDPKEMGQEIGQYALQVGTQNYYNKAYKTNDANAWTDGFLYGLVGKDERGEGVGALVSKEGIEGGILGGITGGLMQAKQKYQEYKAIKGNTTQFLSQLNDGSTFKESFKDRLKSVNRGIILQEQEQDAVMVGDQLEARDLHTDQMHNYLSTRIKYGRMDMVMDDINDLRLTSSSAEGLASLKQQGYANINDTTLSYHERLNKLESFARNTDEFYKSTYLRYGGEVIPGTDQKLYSPEVMDKMVYAMNKIADYDVRIPQLNANLAISGISTLDVLTSVLTTNTPNLEATEAALKQIDELDVTSDVKDELKTSLKDVIELSLRRKLFLEEYDDIKNSPLKHKEADPVQTDPTTGLPVSTKAAPQTIKLKTKDGEKNIETGTEYFLGRVVGKDKDGKPVNRLPKITILGENEDGTVQIKDKNGIRNISKELLEDYRLAKVESTLSDEKARYFLKHWNTEFEHYGRKNKDGTPAVGRLEWNEKDRVLTFTYTRDGKTRSEEVTGDQFKAKKGYQHGIIKAIGELTIEQEQATKEFVKGAEADPRVFEKRRVRIKILTELFDELSVSQEKTTALITKHQEQLVKIREELISLEAEIANAEIDGRAKKSVRFKATTKKALANAMKLSRMQDQLERELERLETEKNETEFNLSYVADLVTNIDELPTDTGEFLEELREQVLDLEILQEKTGKQINIVAQLIKETERAINSFIDFVSSLIKKFESKYPNVPRIMGQDFVDFLKSNPNFLKLKPLYREELADLDETIANIEDGEIVPNENRLEGLKEHLDIIQKDLVELQKEIVAKQLILDRFEEAAVKFRQQEAEEKSLQKNEQLIAQFLGTMDNSVPNTPEEGKRYEPASKKPWESVIGGTIVPSGDDAKKGFSVRANTFGFNFPSFKNKEKIKGIIVTQTTQDQIIPGLIEHLVGDSGADTSSVIALVMVQENEDGSFSLVDQKGQEIAKDENLLDTAIFQVFPLEKLTANYGNGVESMFRETTPELVEASLREQYTAWRKTQLEQTALGVPQSISASFGIPEYVTYTDQYGKEQPDYDSRFSVQEAGLVSQEDLETDAVINIPTTNSIVTKGSTTFTNALGRVFLELPNGLVKLFNRKFNNKEANVIYEALYNLTKTALEEGTLKGDKAQSIIRWLKSTTYWGIPKNLQTGELKPAAYNSIWFDNSEPDEKGFSATKLFISGKGESFDFTPTSLEQNKEAIILLLENMYNNANSSMIKDNTWNNPYVEIVGFDKQGDPITKTWNNYQTYLLSSEGRKTEEIPFTTRVAPITDSKPVNRTGIYFTLDSTADDFVIPSPTPVVAPQAPAPVPPTNTPATPTTSTPPTPSAPQVFKLNGEENVVMLGAFGGVAFTVDGDKYIESNGETGYSVDLASDMIKAIMDAKQVTEEKAKSIIVASVIAKFTPQIDAIKASREVPSEDFTEEEDDDWNSSAPDTPDDKAYRMQLVNQAKQVKKEDWNEIEKFLKKNFPNIPVYRVRNVIKATNGKQAWGMLHNGAIYISEAAEIGTVYHEVFEAVWKMFSSPQERQDVIKEFKSREGSYQDRFTGKEIKYSEATPADIKEELAEEFRDLQLFNKTPKSSLISKLFKDIINFFKTFFTGRNAATNTEQLFERISSGYYAKTIPYENALSYANKGIIDIEDASGDSSSEFRLTIAANYVNDIIQHMTYSTLIDLIKTDKSLFTIPNINKTQLYNTLKQEVLNIIRWQGAQFEKAIANKELTPEEGGQRLNDLKTLWKNVQNEWPEIIKKHEEYLKSYSIEFDENDNIISTDENNSGKGDYQDANKIDSFRRANSAIKLLLATIPRVQVRNQEILIQRSSIGGAILIPSDEIFINLMNRLHNSVNIEDMLNRLRVISLEDPNYSVLYKRITKLSPTSPFNFDKLDENGLQLVSAFWKAFKRQNADVISVFVLPNGDIVISDSTLSSAAKQSKRELLSDVISKIKKDGNPYVSYDPKTLKYNANAKIRNVVLNPADLNSYVSFLSNLGINFELKDIKKLSDNQLKQFKKATEGIKRSVSEISEVATLSSRTLSVDGTLLELGTIKAVISNPVFDSTYFNVNGERTQNFIGTNAVSTLHDALSTANNINDLEKTDFAFLLTDAFTKGSVMLNKMFTMNLSGDRRANTENLLKPVYIDGTINEQKGKNKQSSKLTYKERIIQEINLNLSGIYMNLVPGDASMEWGIRMHNAESAFVTKDLLLNKEYLKIFKDYFISEINLAKEKRSVRDSSDLRFFKSILGEELNKKIKKDLKLPAEEIYELYKKEINSNIEKFIIDAASNTESLLQEYSIIESTEEGINTNNIDFEQGITQESLRTNLKLLELNYMIANIEMHKLIYSDPYQYSDELKRIKNFNSPRQPLVYGSAKINSAYNKQYNKGYKKNDAGYTDFTKDHFRSSVIDDVWSVGELDGYEVAFEETDGGGYISLKANRVFGIRSGEWTDDNEKQYRYDVAWEKRDKGKTLSSTEEDILSKPNPNIRNTYTPRKPIVSGSKADGENFNDIVLDKFALMPISYRVLKQFNPDSNALKLLEKMEKENVDYVVYSSARKVGGGEKTNLYNIDGSFNFSPFKEINTIPFSIVGVQTEVPSKDTPLVTRGSQITKLATLDFLEAGMPIDYNVEQKDWETRYATWTGLTEQEKLAASELYRLIKHNQDLLEAKIEQGFISLLVKLGIKPVITEGGVKGYKLTSPSTLISTLRDEILKREVNENITEALAGFEIGDVVLEATPAYKQIRNILYSIADKSVVSPKISGGMKVQIPSTLLESSRIKATEHANPKGIKKITYSSDLLKFYTNKEGERVCEIMVARWFKSDKTDQELLDYFNSSPEGQKILKGIAFRIPSQKQNSIDVFKIAKFLPQEFGDSVVIPSALVKKTGSDFDIDKLSMYLKNVYMGIDGFVKAVPYFGIGKEAKAKIEELFTKGEFLNKEQLKELDRYITEQTEREQDLLSSEFNKNSAEYKLIQDIFPEAFTEEAFIEEFMKELSSKGIKQTLVDNIYAKSLENEYIESLESLVSHESNFERLVKPNSSKQLEDLAKKINKKLGRKEIDYSDPGNMLSRRFMSSLRQAFVNGKYAIGIAAVGQTNHAQNQRSSMYIDADRLNTSMVSDSDKDWLGDGLIKFQKYNSILVKDKKRPSLSMSKNSVGEFISDIISQFIDGYVDISKGPWIMDLGAQPNITSTWLFLVKIGVPIDTVAYFINQPIIKDYLITVENAGYSWLFIDNFVDSTLQNYSSNTIATEIPSEKQLGDMVGVDVSKMDGVQKAQQQLILKEFLKYAKMAEHLFLVTQGSNFDTANINDPFLVFKKQKQLEKARNTIISSVDDILDQSFIGPLSRAMNEVRDAFSTIFISDTDSKTLEATSVRAVMEKVLTPYVDVNDRDFVKISQKAVSDMFDWAVQTNTKLNDFISSLLLGSDTEESASQKIIKYRDRVLADPTHPLFNNVIINSLRLEERPNGSKTLSPKNLYLTGRDNKIYNQNLIISGFRELRENMKQEQSSLYTHLVRLAIVQSGTSPSPISFTSLLPYEDFKRYYNPTLMELENIPNLGLFYELNVFERNNWNNPDIVTFKPFTLIKSKTSNNLLNLNMQFVDKRLVKAMNTFQIPRVINMSPLSREANSDFVVYTWENKISKADKAKARKKGDRSYINKGLFQKVYTVDNEGKRVPLLQVSEYKGKIYKNLVYKQINAWGDSFRANEFYDYNKASILDNDFIKVEEKFNDKNVKISSKEVEDDVIVSILRNSYVQTTPTSQPLELFPIDSNKTSLKQFSLLPSKSSTPTFTYAGIGSRETPSIILEQMTTVAKELEQKGYTLNTGKTFNNKEEGADKAFSDGTTRKNLFTPENQGSRPREQAIAKEIHPNPSALKQGGLQLMARNTNQIFGNNLDTPVDFVLFYTADGLETSRPQGGTGQAVEMAIRKGIPVINMANPEWRSSLNNILDKTLSKNSPPNLPAINRSPKQC